MTNNISLREWEALSAYLDGQLAQKDRQRLEGRLQSNTELRQALEELRRTRALLRSQPKLRAPRNFTLTPEMVGQRAPSRPIPRAYPTFRLVSALASVMFVLVLIGDFFTAAPAVPTGGAAPVAVMQEIPAEPAAEAAGTFNYESQAAEALPQATNAADLLLAESEESARALDVPSDEAPATKAMPEEGDQGLETSQSLPPGESVVEDETQPVGRTPFPGLSSGLLRGLEVGLAIIAVLAGLVALILRRSVQ